MEKNTGVKRTFLWTKLSALQGLNYLKF